MERLSFISWQDGPFALELFAVDAIDYLQGKRLEYPERAEFYGAAIVKLRTTIRKEIEFAADAQAVANKGKTKRKDAERYQTSFQAAVKRLKEDLMLLSQAEKEELL
ncbi:hypothetical protein FAES_0375 [Fibrella aestuarina BUZ 2]|uniref:Uncharacterized protein n=1 Tax=Fibrella aestuarina BUZ 2 TaxID=1166018 RepID=I0K2N4_9BACT|nr:hypothetical protein [Fibrella aestuarina]CCG98387.1 hypothetical protein FAES_0375 [Fibrella aestuarina BUZ 2]